HAIEGVAKKRLSEMLPPELQPIYSGLLFGEEEQKSAPEHYELVKAADKIAAYLKCLEELKAGNQEFSKAEKTIKAQIDRMILPEVAYFMERFAPSFTLTLDELD
ncbi:MAG TPA: YfbR-like 5'-deoxynucleotidase, partial [Bacillota bacterium]|nr:YfbR-like 5'-deoxynucleotidase [Bacillota bacterium]